MILMFGRIYQVLRHLERYHEFTDMYSKKVCRTYGFRPGRGQHNALDALAYGITKRKVNWVLDLDVQKFFDTVDHAWILKMIQHRVKDRRVLSLIMRWIQVGFVDKEGKRIPQKVRPLSTLNWKKLKIRT